MKSSYLRNNSQGHLWGSIQLAGLLKSTVRQPFPKIVLYHASELALRYTDHHVAEADVSLPRWGASPNAHHQGEPQVGKRSDHVSSDASSRAGAVSAVWQASNDHIMSINTTEH